MSKRTRIAKIDKWIKEGRSSGRCSDFKTLVKYPRCFFVRSLLPLEELMKERIEFY